MLRKLSKRGKIIRFMAFPKCFGAVRHNSYMHHLCASGKQLGVSLTIQYPQFMLRRALESHQRRTLNNLHIPNVHSNVKKVLLCNNLWQYIKNAFDSFAYLQSALLGLLFCSLQLHAQRLPQDGQKGIETTTPNAWLIQWDSYGEGILYEYLITDNPLCTKGCAGDTREGTTKANVHVEFNLKPNVWYYWTYRPILTDTLEGEWLDPYAFFTKPEEIPPFYFANKTLFLDRQAYPNSRKISIHFYNIQGQIVHTTSWDLNGFERIQKQNFPWLYEGLYFLYLSDEQHNFKPLKIWVSP